MSCLRGARRNSLFVVACLAGCAGEITPTPGNAPPDGALPVADAGISLDGNGPAGDAAEFRCRNKITSGLDNGHHNPGQDCLNGCHNHGFYLAGTLYSAASGGVAVAGASITFIDANGVTGDMHTGTNGNFWWSLPVAFPVRIIASSCPDIRSMTGMVTTADAGCNKSGCHAGSGGAGRIHLP